MHSMLPFAKQMLQQSGKFSPYGGLLRPDGSVVQIRAESLPAQDSVSTEHIETLCQRLRERVEQNEAKAAAIVVDVCVTPPGLGHSSCAIEVCVEHRDSYCAEVFFPYCRNEGRLMFGQVFAQRCGMHILR